MISKRVLSHFAAILSIAVLFALFFALVCMLPGCSTGNSDSTSSSQQKESIDLSALKVGDVVNFGNVTFASYLGNDFKKDVPWLVLDIKDGSALIISENIIEFRPYWEGYAELSRQWNDEYMANLDSFSSFEELDAYIATLPYEKEYGPIAATWENSTIRTWLNGPFYDGLPDDLKSRILLTNVANEENPVYIDAYSTPGNATDDKVFLLSTREASTLFSSDDDRIANIDIFATSGDKIAGNWLLRSPGYFYNTVTYVSSSGDTGYHGEPAPFKAVDIAIGSGDPAAGRIIEMSDSLLLSDAPLDIVLTDEPGIRPAMWISLASDPIEQAAQSTSEEQSDTEDAAVAPAASEQSATPSTTPPIPEGAISWTDARSYVGKTVTVYGPVEGTNYAKSANGGPTYIDIGADYPDTNRVSAVIWAEDRDTFPSAPESLYDGKNIVVTGEIYIYDGACNIKVTSPSQIQVLNN